MILFVTSLATFITALDSNIVTIALVRISSDFSANYSYVAWVVTGYLVSLVALVILFGKLTDVYGRKGLYIAGFVIFGISSALCGFSQTIVELIVFRVIQGGSAALFFAISRPLLLDTFSSREISFAFGINTAMYSLGAVLGPVVGGLLVALDWRLIFYVNVPIAIIATLLTTREVPKGVPRDPSRSVLQSFDPLDAGLFVLTVTLLMIWLTFYVPTIGILGVAALAALVVSELRSRNPLINRKLRATRGFVYALLAVILLCIGYSGITFAMSFYFQSILGLKSAESGILISPLPVALAVGSVVAGRIHSRLKNPLMLSALATLACGLGVVALSLSVGFETPLVVPAVAFSVVGLAVGLYWVPLLTAAMRFPQQDVIGAASGTFATFANMSGAVSIALTVAISGYFLPLASQVFSGGLVNLSHADALLFKTGIESAIFVAGVTDLAAVPFILLMMKEWKRAGKTGTPIIAESGPV